MRSAVSKTRLSSRQVSGDVEASADDVPDTPFDLTAADGEALGDESRVVYVLSVAGQVGTFGVPLFEVGDGIVAHGIGAALDQSALDLMPVVLAHLLSR